MSATNIIRVAVGFFVFICFLADAHASTRGAELYAEHCAKCHHPKRLGLTAPPLIPELLSKRNAKRLGAVIAEGLPATQMPAYGDTLTEDDIGEIVAFIKTRVDNPVWSFDDIDKSRIATPDQNPRTHTAELENVTLVMERGTKSIAVLDGKDLSEMAKFYVGNVHGGPKFSYDLKKIYSASRDGIVTKFDIPTLVGEFQVKGGIYSRSVAVSPDNTVVALANQLPKNIVFFNEKMEPVHEIDVPEKIGGFYSLPQLDAFICSFREKPELWIIDAKAPFAVTKYDLPGPFEDFSISPAGNYILGTKRGSGKMYIYDYKEHRIMAEIPTKGLPHLASAAFWYRNGELMAGVNHIKEPLLTIYSLDRLVVEAEIRLPAAGFFVRTHFATPYLWVDTMTEEMVLIDKTNFKNWKIIVPHKGRKSMHVEFTREGEYALVTIPGKGGGVVIYDAATLHKIKALPYESPVGKYNATNKTYPAYAMGNQGGYAKMPHPGEAVFQSYCMGCHHQVYDAFGPSFTEIANTRTSSQVKMQILSPKATSRALGYNRSSMSHIKLSTKDLDNIVSYIMSFKEAADN